MHIYLVGGAVRDHLLAQWHPDWPAPVQADRDWVVVGTTPEALLALGYRPVGQDFPVFLHPVTHEEYALARTERKSGVGHQGFVFHTSPDTTLEQDLARRDLTINAMAWPVEALSDWTSLGPHNAPSQLIDPYGGLADLRDGLLRHITPAFAEDPLRVLRVARFAARWPTFEVAAQTQTLMREMVCHGELSHLAAERVWQELSKGLAARQPSRMLQVLVTCGAWAALLEPMPCGRVPQQAVDHLARAGHSLPARFAALWWGTSPEVLSTFCQRQRVPKGCESVAALALRSWSQWLTLLNNGAAAAWPLLQSSDALRRPDRLADATACWVAWSVTTGVVAAGDATRAQNLLLHALQVAAQTRLPSSADVPPGPAWGTALSNARARAVEAVWHSEGG